MYAAAGSSDRRNVEGVSYRDADDEEEELHVRVGAGSASRATTRVREVDNEWSVGHRTVTDGTLHISRLGGRVGSHYRARGTPLTLH